MHWNVSTLIPILSAVSYGGILIVVAYSKPRNRLRRIFGTYLAAMFVWSVSGFLAISGLVDVLSSFRVMAASPIAMMLAIFYFVQTLFGIRRKWTPLAILYGMIAIILVVISPIVIKEAYIDSLGELHYQFGHFFWIVATPGYFLFIWSLVELIRGDRQTNDANQRNRLRYLILGLFLTSIVTFVNFTPLGKYPIDIAANVITALLIAYAILRYQLLDIRVVFRIGLLYSLTTAIFGTVYYLIISLALNLFQLVSGRWVFLISVAIGTLTAYLLSPIRDNAQRWVDRLFYREKYNAGLMLERLTETVASLLDLDKITELVLSEIMEALHIEQGAIFIKQPPAGDFHVSALRSNIKEATISSIRADHPIVTWMARQIRILTKNELDINPVFKAIWGEEKKALDDSQAELFVPIYAKGELVGILVLGPKLSKQPYDQDDQHILSAVANQTAVAIENARLYDHLEETFVQTVVTLANAIDMRDTYTSDHSQRIATWAVKTAQLLGCAPEEVKAVYWGGLLHDIGKIGIPDSILNKPAPLSKAEWDIMKTHTTRGSKLISPITKLSDVAPIIEYSHERFDGYGYPHGLKGEAVVDSFSAMRDKRPYKEPYSLDKTVKELKDNSGKMYDPKVVEAFLQILDTNNTH
jgi:HD-GYP domain-containing protein (c-di-GMP phosphodiesterase class II)